jgi:hypothetical protein
MAAGAAEAAGAALGALIAGGALDPVELANEAAQGGGGLRGFSGAGDGGKAELLTPQDALLWCACPNILLKNRLVMKLESAAEESDPKHMMSLHWLLAHASAPY